MDVSYSQHASLHADWRRDSSQLLMVALFGEGVQLRHIDTQFNPAEAANISLSPCEAADVAQRIRGVLAGEPAINSEAIEGQARLVVRYTNDGEPFREGVALCLDFGDYERDFTFEMDSFAARAVAASLEKAAEMARQLAPQAPNCEPGC